MVEEIITQVIEQILDFDTQQIKRVLGYINKNVSDITEGDLNGFLDAYKRIRNVSNVYLDGIRLIISSFFTWLHKKGIISKNHKSE